MNPNWQEFFQREEALPEYLAWVGWLTEQRTKTKVYPPQELVFHAFDFFSPKDTKVVILGQDPYHEPGQAMGLSFSVPKGTPLPPSLRNIYKELADDLGIVRDKSNGDLTNLASQGILFLNANLTVEEGRPLSHSNPFYSRFAGDVLSYLNDLDESIVFIFWGGFAKKYARIITNEKHLVLTANHPSPLSANRGGFFGSKPFSKVNRFLEANGRTPIDWGK